MDLNETKILSQIFGIVRRLEEGSRYDNVSGDTPIAELQLDSMNVTQLLVELESQFELTLADDELDRVTTLSDLAKCILQRRVGG